MSIVVSGTGQLLNALAAAKGGETILLAAGGYGDVELKQSFASKVTLKAVEPGTVDFKHLRLNGADNIELDGLSVNYLHTQFSSGITVKNSSFESGVYFRDSDGVVLDGNDIEGGYHASIFNDVTNFEITNNYIHHAQSDLIRVTGDSWGGLVQNNTLYDTAGIRYSDGTYDHADLIQFFARDGKTPHDMVIRGNYLYDDLSTGVIPGQGIFVSDPASGGYRDFLIEDNLINVASVNSIYINGATENFVVRNNTLMPNDGDSGGIIRLAEKSGRGNPGAEIYGNVAKRITDETRDSDISDNYVYGYGADLGRLFSGPGSSWEGFVPPSNGPVSLNSNYGAQNRLRELMGDEVPELPSPNIGPNAADDGGYTTEAGAAMSIAVSDLLANDTDADGDTLSITGVSALLGGSVAIDNAMQSVRFTPDAGFSGATGFDYTIADGKGGFDTATVSVTVNPTIVTQQPDPDRPSAVLSENTPLEIDASHYDTGGQNVSYYDATDGIVGTGASDGGRRGSDVEQTVGGDIGYVWDGEWLEYTVDVQSAGTYALSLNMASKLDDRALSIDIFRKDEDSAYQTLDTAGSKNTGSWSSFDFVDAGSFALEAGANVIRVTFENGAQDLRSLRLTSVADETEGDPKAEEESVNRIVGTASDDTLFGGDGEDRLIGKAGDDVLFGGGDNDRLFGGDGDDIFHGGAGRNVVASGAGADEFHLTSEDSVLVVRDFDVLNDSLVFLDSDNAEFRMVVNNDVRIFSGETKVRLLGIESLQGIDMDWV
ncbi:MAG: cadherin-like domain-containing protein [Pseudomonadota bacterium]